MRWSQEGRAPPAFFLAPSAKLEKIKIHLIVLYFDNVLLFGPLWCFIGPTLNFTHATGLAGMKVEKLSCHNKKLVLNIIYFLIIQYIRHL